MTIKTTLFVVLLGCMALAAHADSGVRRYDLPDHGALALKVPDGWVDNVSQPPDRLPPTISLKQGRGPAFDVLITPVWSFDPNKPVSSSLIQQVARSAADKALTQSVERKIELKPIKGASGTGYYFSATDRAPPPGDYKYMTQGGVMVGEIMMTFTILTNDGQEAIVKQAMAMMTSAQHIRR